jgi:hypothetical protein
MPCGWRLPRTSAVVAAVAESTKGWNLRGIIVGVCECVSIDITFKKKKKEKKKDLIAIA